MIMLEIFINSSFGTQNYDNKIKNDKKLMSENKL